MFALIAQKISNPALGEFGNQTGEEFLSKLVPALVELILVIGFLAFVFTFLMGGIKWITSNGDKGKLAEAQQTVSNALLGLVILFMFFGILSFVECFFGIGLRTIKIAKYSIGFDSIPVCNSSGGSTDVTPPPITEGGTGDTLDTALSGDSLCAGCITDGCGIVGETYMGAGSQKYDCTTEGWVATDVNPVTSTVCGTCN